MPWTKTNYPASMTNLPEAVRDKAIGIANALLKEKNMDEGIAIATVISRAKGRTDSIKKVVKKHDDDRYVIPHEGP